MKTNSQELWNQVRDSPLAPGIIIIDADNRIVDVNHLAYSLAQLSDRSSPGKQDIIGQPVSQFINQWPVHPQHQDFNPNLLLDIIKSAKDSDQIQEQIFCLAGKQDQEVWLQAQAASLKSPQGYIGLTFHDITRRYQHERQRSQQLAEIADQNRQWQAIFNGVQESIVLIDRSGLIMTMNPATEKMTGRKTADMIGRHVAHLFPKIDPQTGRPKSSSGGGFEQVLRDSKPSSLLEALVGTQDNRHIWVNYSYTPLRDSKGEIIGFIRVTSDVSTVKAVDQMKNDFISIASHELRTPLGVINSYLNLFLAGQLGPLTDDQKLFMQRIYGSSGDMSALVEDLLNMSRIEDGRIHIANQEYDLLDLVHEVISHLEPRYKAKNIEIAVASQIDNHQIVGDRQKVEQALTNLIDNAIKYTYDNGRIDIELSAGQDVLKVSITDSGVGIRPENLTHIFEKFYREGNPLSIKEGGSGLGLYISQKLIELHGGRISATSKHNRGSTFTVSLPTHQPASIEDQDGQSQKRN